MSRSARSNEFWNRVYQAFQPGEILVGKRSHELYCEREDSPLDIMRLDFRPGLDLPRPPIAYFTGHRGSGKSSMLWRLLETFKDDYFVVYFDIDHNLDANTANQIDLLYLLGSTVFQVAVQEGLEPKSEYLKQLSRSIFSLTETQRQPIGESVDIVELASKLICFGSGALGGSLAEKTAEKLTHAFLKPFHLSSGVNKEIVLRRESEPQVQQIINNVNLIIADVKTQANREVLVVADGLDKLRRLDQAKLIFLESDALTGPVCRIIYTVPMLIYLDLAFGEAEEGCSSYLLPNVKLYGKDSDHRYRRGYDTMREVAMKRLRSIELEINDLFTPRTMDFLIEKSGGIMRWFIEMVKDACNSAYSQGLDRINIHAARQAVNIRARKLAIRLDMKRKDELQKIRRNKIPTSSSKVAELLQSRMVVTYFNGETWFDAHPLLWEALDR